MISCRSHQSPSQKSMQKCGDVERSRLKNDLSPYTTPPHFPPPTHPAEGRRWRRQMTWRSPLKMQSEPRWTRQMDQLPFPPDPKWLIFGTWRNWRTTFYVYTIFAEVKAPNIFTIYLAHRRPTGSVSVPIRQRLEIPRRKVKFIRLAAQLLWDFSAQCLSFCRFRTDTNPVGQQALVP